MRKLIITFMMMALMVVGLPLALPTETPAQQSVWYQKYRDSRGRIRYRRVAKPSVYRRHRNLINVAAGTGAGALLGGIIGGRKGMAIGAGTGAGASALYTYVFNKKKRKYVRVRRY
jgi:hypothetical protein